MRHQIHTCGTIKSYWCPLTTLEFFMCFSILQQWLNPRVGARDAHLPIGKMQLHIHDSPQLGVWTLQGGNVITHFCQILPKICIKLKEFGRPRWERASKILLWIRQWNVFHCHAVFVKNGQVIVSPVLWNWLPSQNLWGLCLLREIVDAPVLFELLL